MDNITGKIVGNARKNMRQMLNSLHSYNSRFLLNDIRKKFLDKILFTMSLVDRKFFVSSNWYDDNAIGIGKGQTISQPSTVARMLVLLDIQPGDDVLEIGAGSGWNACLLSYLAYPGKVISIERINSLTEKARGNFRDFIKYVKRKRPEEYQKFSKLQFFTRDVFKSGKERFDKIIFTAGISAGNEDLIKKLAEKMLKKQGILICPRIAGSIIIYKRSKKVVKQETREEYVFVPLLRGTEE